MSSSSAPSKGRTRPLFIVLSGPSGVGKDAVISELKRRGCSLYHAITATTRPRRPGETDGVDYYFVSPARFQEMVEGGELLEWAPVYGHWYGVPKRQVKEALAAGRDVIVRVDVQGATSIKALAPEAVFIFLAPASLEDLKQRLRQRATEAAAELRVRLEKAEEEMGRLPMFDYLVVNHQGQVGQAAIQIEAIITAEKCRVKQRVVEL